MIRKIYRKIVPRKIRVILELIRKKEVRERIEKRKRYGKKNPDKIFYIIRIEQDDWGLFTTVISVLQHIKYALIRDYIPIVDFKHYRMGMWQDQIHFGLENAWEYYFEPIIPEISLEEVYDSRNVILSEKGNLPRTGIADQYHELSPDVLAEYHTLVQKYLRPRQEIIKQIAEQKQRLFPKNGKILGVAIRRAFVHHKATNMGIIQGHSEQADIDEYVTDIEYLMNTWGCEYLFVSVEDRETSDFFVKKYGEKCIRMNRPLMHWFEEGKALKFPDELNKIQSEFLINEKNECLDMEKLAKAYMIEVYLLAQCDCLLASMASGVQMACILNNGSYEHVKIYNKGLIDLKEEK